MDAVCTSKAQYLRLDSWDPYSRPTQQHVDESNSHGIDYPSPVRNVPSEVLSHIFVLCSCDYPIPLPYHGQWEVPHQVAISRVCSRWRQVALGRAKHWCAMEQC